MMKLVNMSDLKSDAVRLPGASPGGDTKVCCICKKELNLECFSFKIKSKNIRQAQCKECKKTYHDDYYLNNKPKYAEAKQRGKDKGYRSDKLLTAYINSFKVNGCVLCKETFYGALDFHHIDPKQKDKAVARATSKAYVKSEVEKCVVLCSNCHRKFHCNYEPIVKALKEYLNAMS